MSGYDSDSSLSDAGAGDISTTVLLGYASKTPTEDTISHLGGDPEWPISTQPPSSSYAQCGTCHGMMSLLLQLNGDLPDRFPYHERRLYIWTCRRKACRRKPGSVRALRATKVTRAATTKASGQAALEEARTTTEAPKQDVGAALFGGSNPRPAGNNMNPFSSGKNASSMGNPFASAKGTMDALAAKPPQRTTATTSTETSATPKSSADLSESFASKLSMNTSPPSISTSTPFIPWPSPSEHKLFPYFHLDADTEYLDPSYETSGMNGDTSASSSSGIRSAFMDIDSSSATTSRSINGESGGAAEEDKVLFESQHDKTFQRFADRIAQNPEQVLRYEFGGMPLLYNDRDDVGRLFSSSQHSTGKITVSSSSSSSQSGSTSSRIPRCKICGSARVFELQLVPNTIAELEADVEAATLLSEGMEWGTIILGVCEKDCLPSGVEIGQVGYVEEWCGVQWEEVVKRDR